MAFSLALLVGCEPTAAPVVMPSRPRPAEDRAAALQPPPPQEGAADGRVLRSYPNREFSPSFVDVLANPERFHGHRIRLEGFIHIEFEGNEIYFSKDHADRLMDENALAVSFDKSKVPFDGVGPTQFHRKWVSVVGVFDKDGRGHMSRCSGALRDIEQIEELKRWYDD